MRSRRTHFVEGHHYEIDPATDCWNWLMQRDRKGYGLCGRGKNDTRERRAHRESWRLTNGPIPPGLVLDHLCRNPSCINPTHLEPVTQAVNTWRGDKAKLSLKIVASIRERILAGEPLTTMAREYDVSVDCIYQIAEDRRWREDPDAPRQPLHVERDCLNCGKRVHGRRNKKFCTPICRSNWNGRARYARLKAAVSHEIDEKGRDR